MTLPVPLKTWVFTANGQSSLNQRFEANDSYNQCEARLAMLYHVKRTLCGFEQGPWTVVQSKNGWAAGYGGDWGAKDTWTSVQALGRYVSGGEKVWIVLQNTFCGQTVQILIYTINSGQVVGQAWVSPAPFGASVGGAVPSIPAAAMKWCADYTTNNMELSGCYEGESILNVTQAWSESQGVEAVRMWCNQQGTIRAWAFLDRLVDQPVGGLVMAQPWVGIWHGRMENYPPYATIISNTNNSTLVHANLGTGLRPRVQVYAVTLANVNGTMVMALTGGRNSLAAALPLQRLEGFMTNQEGGSGYIGRPADFWLGASVPHGTYYAPDMRLVQLGQFVWPWDPSAGKPQTF